MSEIFSVNRREFLLVSSAAAAGLVVGCRYVPSSEPRSVPSGSTGTGKVSHKLSTFVQVATSGEVTIWVSKSEMGQGIRTALPMIVAEELDVEWSRVSIRQADLDKVWGSMGTGGSSSVRSMWTPLRTAGAAARLMLVGAAAKWWSVDPSSCTTEAGHVVHAATGRKIGYGELAEAASAEPVPEAPRLKAPEDFRIIGKSLDRLDNRSIAAGEAQYGLDVRVPGMLFAAIARPPAFGAMVRGFDAAAAKAMAGVRDVFAIEPAKPPNHVWGGVCVVAESTWIALRARDALKIEWDMGPNANENDAQIASALAKLTESKGKVVRGEGDADKAIDVATRRVDATYELPLLAHAPMEPQNCTAHFRDGGFEIWAPTQFADWAAGAVAEITGVPVANVTVHVTLMGGGFGRRAFPDFVIEAAIASKRVGAPVKVVFTREDDTRYDYYRPATHHRLAGAIDALGKVAAWRHRIASTPIDSFMDPAAATPESSEIGGADDIPFVVPNLAVEFHAAKSAVPRGWWRSVEHSFNAFAVESFVDELAAAAERDPLALRLELIGADRKIEGSNKNFPFDTGRFRRVLELAAEKAGWGAPLLKGRGRGIAVHRSFYSYVAHVAEVTVSRDGSVKVDRVVSAIDCGIPVNPDGIVAQLESSIVYGVTALFKGKVSIDKGGVVEGNFDTYPLMTMAESPAMEVHIVPSGEAPTGTGEPGLPPIAPAVTNAIFAATGKRVRRLPLRKEDLA